MLTQLTEFLDGDKSAVLAQNRESGEARFLHGYGFDGFAVKSYEQYYGKISVLFQDARSRSLGAIYTDEMYPDYAVYQESEIYNDYFKPNRIDHLMQAYIAGDRRSLLGFVIRRNSRHSFFGPGSRHRFAALEPHIRRAWALSERLVAMEANSHAALDAVRDGVVLVDYAGRLCFANAAAERMLSCRDGLSVCETRLVAARGEEAQRLRHLVAGAAGFGRGADLPPGGDMAVTRPSGRRPFLLSVTPVGPGGFPGTTGRAAATVTIADPDDRPAPPEERLAALFGLTPAEARLAAAMATGDSLEDIAGRLSLTRESARTTLKRVYAKTDTHRQAELVRLLLSVPSATTKLR